MKAAPFAVYVVYKFAFELNIDLVESSDDKREPKEIPIYCNGTNSIVY